MYHSLRETLSKYGCHSQVGRFTGGRRENVSGTVQNFRLPCLWSKCSAWSPLSFHYPEPLLVPIGGPLVPKHLTPIDPPYSSGASILSVRIIQDVFPLRVEVRK